MLRVDGLAVWYLKRHANVFEKIQAIKHHRYKQSVKALKSGIVQEVRVAKTRTIEWPSRFIQQP